MVEGVSVGDNRDRDEEQGESCKAEPRMHSKISVMLMSDMDCSDCSYFRLHYICFAINSRAPLREGGRQGWSPSKSPQ